MVATKQRFIKLPGKFLYLKKGEDLSSALLLDIDITYIILRSVSD